MSYQAKHAAAFINMIADEGTKAEAIDYLQRTWDELVEVRKELNRVTRGDVSNIITTLADALTHIAFLERDKQSLKTIADGWQQKFVEQSRTNAQLRFALQTAWPYVHQHCTINSARNEIAAAMGGKPTSVSWQMMLKSCPDGEFTAFFQDNPSMLYAVEMSK